MLLLHLRFFRERGLLSKKSEGAQNVIETEFMHYMKIQLLL